jgi:UPF0716 family protein affecting phage T7 exclusion
MPRIGCLALLVPGIAALALLALEAWVFIKVCHWLGDWLAPTVVVVVSSVIGGRLLAATIRAAPMALLGGNSGRLLLRAMAGVALLFPGLCTSALGVLLLLPGLDRLFKRLGDRVVAAVMRYAMKRMMGGKQGGFTMFAGFQGGGFPGAFPGAPPSPPDDQRPLPRSGGGGKIIDTTAERGDQP